MPSIIRLVAPALLRRPTELVSPSDRSNISTMLQLKRYEYDVIYQKMSNAIYYKLTGALCA